MLLSASALPRLLLPAMLIVLALPGGAAEVLPAPLIGLWQVQDSACRACDPQRGPEAGAELRLTPQFYQNPFQSDCLQAPVAQQQIPETLGELKERLGLPARWLTAAGDAQTLTRSWRLSCGRGPSFMLILLPDGTLLMPVEASTTLRLARRG